MGMEVDQAGRDDQPAHVADHFAFKPRPKLRDAAVAKTDVHDGVDALGRIDDAAAAQDEIKDMRSLSLA